MNAASQPSPVRTGVARALSKLGRCSRSQGISLVKEGRVSVNGRTCRNPEQPVLLGKDRIAVDGVPVSGVGLVYLMLNKPRGLVTTASDESGRDTVYTCFKDASLPHLSPVGRLDKASEGLLLFTNDNAWAHRITDPATHLSKTYHVQVAARVEDALVDRLKTGAIVDGEHWRLQQVEWLRGGEKNTWLAITLDEGRNRHIRRVLEQHGLEVLRLVRVSIGKLQLGSLSKGAWRHIRPEETGLL